MEAEKPKSKSCNTAIGGTIDTGKTHTAKQYAELLAHRLINGDFIQVRPIIVLDHSDNATSYEGYTVIPMEYLQKDLDILNNPQFKRVRICVDDDDDIDEFCKYLIHFQRDVVVIFDDIGNYFTGNLSDIQKKVIKTPKNNGIDLIYQFHSWKEIAPKLLAVCSVAIVKETPDKNIKNIDRLQMSDYMQILNKEVIEENKHRESGKKYATRILDNKYGKVTVMDLNNNFKTYNVYDYFAGKL